MRITISELAKMAGVSKTTISRVINEKPDVDPETRQKILGLIQTYGFQPNALAKAISQQKSQYIGLLIPHEAEYVFSNPFYTEVMRGVSTAADQRGYYLLVCYAHESNYLDIYRQKRVDGFVLLSPGSFHQHIITSLENEKVAFVSTAKVSEDRTMTYVDVDNYHGAVLAMEHLVELGHKRIAYIGKPTLQSSIDRRNGYLTVMQKYGLPCCDHWLITSETSSVQSGHDDTLTLLQGEDKPTAIFLANDMMAVGAVKAVQAMGLHVPEDISIVGFDDVSFSNYIMPPLTTVRQPSFEKGVAAVGALIETLETGLPQDSIILPVELVVRQSTAAPRNGL